MLFDTYLHGFFYLTIGGGRFHKIRNAFFSVVILGAASMFAYQVYLNVFSYLQFNVATAVSFQHLAYGSKGSSLNFPAITICSNNMFLANQVGFVIDGSSAEAVLMAKQQTPSLRAAYEASHECVSNVATEPAIIANYTGIGTMGLNLGAAFTMQQYGTNSINSVLACKWQEKPINCSDLFLNRLTDVGYCFTFYPSANLVNSYSLLNTSVNAEVASPAFQNSINSCFWAQQSGCTPTSYCAENYVPVQTAAHQGTAYGTTGAQIAKYNLTTSSTGSRSGLQLFMDVQPQEFCAGNGQPAFGFIALPHDRDVAPILQIESALDIPAGFVANVAISVTKIDRRGTESMGKCASNRSIQWYQTLEAYSKDACIVSCLGDLFQSACGCVPYFAPPALLATKLGFQASCVAMPWLNCYLQLWNGFNYTAYPEAIPEVCMRHESFGCLVETCNCPEQCTETQYTTQTSYAPLESLAAYEKLVGKQLKVMTLSEFRKTFVLANFFFKTLDVTLVTETQAVQLMDVVNGIGGSFGLCLGGSIPALAAIVINYLVPLTWKLVKSLLMRSQANVSNISK